MTLLRQRYERVLSLADIYRAAPSQLDDHAAWSKINFPCGRVSSPSIHSSLVKQERVVVLLSHKVSYKTIGGPLRRLDRGLVFTGLSDVIERS